MSQVSHKLQFMLHDKSHNKYRKVIHRSYNSCIENLTGTLSSSLC